jgi:hypothetical protein
VNGVRVLERLSPQLPAPTFRELLGPSLHGEPAPFRRRTLIDNLKMPKLVKEHVVQHEPANSQFGPLPIPPRAKVFGRLPAFQGRRKAQARR